MGSNASENYVVLHQLSRADLLQVSNEIREGGEETLGPGWTEYRNNYYAITNMP